MKIAAIGVGAWGKNIVRTLSGRGVLIAVAEASEQLRTAVALDYPGVEILPCYSALLGREDIDAVVIATPAETHYRIASEFLRAGKDVLLEKPMTLAAADAEKLVSEAVAHQRVLMVGHLLLYKPAIQFLRDYLSCGALGKVFTLHQERMKLGRARSAENALWSLGVHDIAMILYLVGSAPLEVAVSGHCGLQAGIEDDTYLHMKFGNGCHGHIHSSWLWPEDRRGLKIIAEGGMLIYNEAAETVVLSRKRIDSSLRCIDEGSVVLFEAPAGFEALAAEIDHFIECVLARTEPRSSGRSGVEVVKVMESASHIF